MSYSGKTLQGPTKPCIRWELDASASEIVRAFDYTACGVLRGSEIAGGNLQLGCNTRDSISQFGK